MVLAKSHICLECKKEIEGRIDKLFCDTHCKASYHYKKKREKQFSLFKRIDLQLKQNRKLLMHYNQAGKAIIRKDVLLKAGFNPGYFTHYWKNAKGHVYLFCYEYGFLATNEKNVQK